MTPAEQVREALENVARAICVAHGRDPDMVTNPWSKGPVVCDLAIPMWWNYRHLAEAALAALSPAADEVLLKVRWDGDRLFAGHILIAELVPVQNYWEAYILGRLYGSFSTRAAACDALVQKIRGG